MRAIVAAFAALIAIVNQASEAQAQQPGRGWTVVAGVTLGCADFRGHAVQTYRMSGLGDAGRSLVVGRVPIISLDTEVMASLSGKLQIFFYLHECGHHVLAHMFNPTPEAENEADCWSIRTGRQQSYFNRADVESFGQRLAASPGTRSGHLPGPQRLEHMLACFDGD